MSVEPRRTIVPTVPGARLVLGAVGAIIGLLIAIGVAPDSPTVVGIDLVVLGVGLVF